jgi:molybdopterin synthase sulfur carrier subunit
VTTLKVPVSIPGLLRDCTGGRATVTVDAATIAGAMAALLRDFPLLRVHLFDEQMQLRKHVLVFHNDESTKRLPSLDVPLREGDRLTIVQAVSGGSRRRRR